MTVFFLLILVFTKRLNVSTFKKKEVIYYKAFE